MAIPDDSAVQDFIEHMLSNTVRLMRDVSTFPENFGLASGVLVARPDDSLLLTAGHIFDKPGLLV